LQLTGREKVLEIAQLKTFLAVARHHNLTTAAEELHLSQPAVTRQIQRLEQWCGLPLLERHGRATRLTDAGEVLRAHAEQVLLTVDNCRSVLDDLRAGRRGNLVLGAGLTTVAFTLPGLIQQFKRRWPDIDLAIRTGATQEILQLILEQQIDLGFVTSPVKHPECSVRILFDDRIVLVSDAALPFAGISISLDELSTLPLILYAPSGFRNFVEDALRQVDVTPKVALELDNIEGIKRMVAAGVGYAFVPHSAVQEELGNGRLVEVPVRGLPPLIRQTSLVHLRQSRPSLAFRAFLEILEQRWPHHVEPA
jgi:DNA-binding transcriptional LysR family regulator